MSHTHNYLFLLQTPTHSDGAPSKGFPRDYPTSSSSRAGMSTDGRRPSGRSLSSGSDQGGFSDPGENILDGTRRDASSDGKVERVKDAEAHPSTTDERQTDPDRVKSDISSSSRSVEEQFMGRTDGSTASARSLFLGKGLQERVYVRKLTESDIQEQREALGRASSGNASFGVKRKFTQMENTSENIASIVRTAAKEYEKSEALQKQQVAKSVPIVQQSKKFAGGIDEPSSSNDYPKDVDRRRAEAISTSTRVGGPTQQGRPSGIVSAKPAVSSGIGVSKVTPGLGNPKGTPVRKPGVLQGQVSKKVVSLGLKPYSEKVSSVTSTWKASPQSAFTKMYQQFVSQRSTSQPKTTMRVPYIRHKISTVHPLPANLPQRPSQGHTGQRSLLKAQPKPGHVSVNPPLIKVGTSKPGATSGQQKAMPHTGAGTSTQKVQRSEGQRSMLPASSSSFVAQFARHAGISQDALVTSSTSSRPQGVRMGSSVTGGQVVRPGSGVMGQRTPSRPQGVRMGSSVTGGQVVRPGSEVMGQRTPSRPQGVRMGSNVTGGQVVRSGSGVRMGSNVTGGQVVQPGSGVRMGSNVTGGQVVRPGSGVMGQRTPLSSRTVISSDRPPQRPSVSSAAGRSSPSVGISSTATERQVAAGNVAATSAADNSATSRASERRETGDNRPSIIDSTK